MNINEFLLGALENILGKGHRRARGNFAFTCPMCNHRKPKLEINLDMDSPSYQYYECWVCGEKGRSIRTLLNHLHLSKTEIAQVMQFVGTGTGTEENKYQSPAIRLPDEFQSLYLAPLDSYEANRFKHYLYNRGLTDQDFVKYNVGYCLSGKYKDRVILPSYNENNCLNYFVARSLDPDAYLRYLNPEVERDNIICFENFIDWEEPLIICEGFFDALAIKRNCTCLLGKNIPSALMKKIIENPVPQIFLVLDQDARKAALKHCETFLKMGKEVYFVTPPKKDPSESGFELMTRTLQSAEEFTFSDLVKCRLDI